jgi:3-oxoacyl-[acyl-carrier protein] reductase
MVNRVSCQIVKQLSGRIALVTGSSRGIGAAIAEVFAGQGAVVAVHGRDAGAVAAVTARIESAGGQAMAAIADLTQHDQVDAMREAIERRHGPVEILVANAGGNPMRPGPLEEITEAGWRESVDANLTATFLTIRAFLPAMKKAGRGTIITMSSAAARRPTAQSPIGYGVAKAGIELLTKAVALQAGPAGVRVNCIAPETILTERNQRQIPPDVQERLRLAHPIQRLGVPDDVAQAAVFLASDQSGWISGATLDVAGGSVLV